MSYADNLNDKLNLLLDKLLYGKSFSELQDNISKEIKHDDYPRYAVFLSVCDKKERAKVFRAAAYSIEDAWKEVCHTAVKYVRSKDLNPVWVKADIMCRSELLPLVDVIKTISGSYNEFFRRGLAFDEKLTTALIEAELNGNRLISYKKQTIELAVINKHLSANNIPTISAMPQNVVVFDCISAFCDEDNNVYSLYGEGLNCGRRNIGDIDKEMTMELIIKSSTYLSMMVGLDGKFDYGFYPIFHKGIPGYNIMRHASSIWSLLCAYRLTGDSFTLGQAQKAIAYMVNNTYNKYKLPPEEENTVFLAELTKNEVKVGGNGVAIIMLSEYIDISGETRLIKLCKELGNGILELMNEDGGFWHVLNFPSLTPKEEFRTVYYEGECVFALCRLYSITKEQKYLDAAERAVNRFIRENYTKHCDHWVAYAINEITKYLPKEEYFEFGLKNAQVNLRRIYERKTTYHTFLELLTVTYELYQRIVSENHEVKYLEKFDYDFFMKTIMKRANHMLIGFGYPEYVMYFKYPEKALDCFFVRHDGYRIRIDDIQHNCGAYYSLYKNILNADS